MAIRKIQLLSSGTLWVMIAIILGSGVLVQSCSREHRPRGTVIIMLDTVRPDHLSCYGYERETSPVLARLAGRGVLFETVVSFAPWTLPSVASFLAGTRPGPGVFVQGRLQQSLAESFRDAGFATAAFTEGGFVSRFFGFDLGFADYHEEEGAVQLRGQGQPRNSNPSGGIANTFRRAKA
jgi:arylsulfatase A-like enzyme